MYGICEPVADEELEEDLVSVWLELSTSRSLAVPPKLSHYSWLLLILLPDTEKRLFPNNQA